MINDILQEIYSNTIETIRKNFKDDSFDYKKGYREYLSSKYEALLSEFISEESDTMVRAIVDSYKKDEIHTWENLSKDEMLSLLDSDPAFEYLRFLSNIAFEQAAQSKRTGVFGNDENECQKRLKELTLCSNKVKPYNVKAAKKLLSEAILDTEYSFGKTGIMSLRLAHVY